MNTTSQTTQWGVRISQIIPKIDENEARCHAELYRLQGEGDAVVVSRSVTTVTGPWEDVRP